MRIEIKPLSINEAWQGRRFKTNAYKAYSNHLSMLLKPFKMDLNGSLSLKVTFGYSSHASDIDNGLKPLIDVLQKKYQFNDNQIYELHVKKEIVKKGNEFINIEFTTI